MAHRGRSRRRALPGFQFTERHVNRIITGELRHAQTRGRGGGREFHWSDLPEKARAEYLKRTAYQNALRETDPETRAAVRLLEADARAAIIAARQNLRRRAQSHQRQGHEGVLRGLCQAPRRSGALGYETVPRIEPHRIMSWERKLRSGGTTALVDGRGRPPGGSWIEDDERICAPASSPPSRRVRILSAAPCSRRSRPSCSATCRCAPCRHSSHR
jgi:hypothetical protein